MSEPVNLNKFRKAKARAGKQQSAKENRAQFGRTKLDKALEAARASKAASQVDGHRLDTGKTDED